MKMPYCEIDRLSPVVKELFLRWTGFLYTRVNFNHPESPVHAAPHSERVLLYSLILTKKIFGDDNDALTAVAHAAVFHDTRRLNDYEDTGHGARAALYYKQFCLDNPDMDFYPEAALMMKYHDIEDGLGKTAIRNEFERSLPRMLLLYDIFKDADALDRWRLGCYGFDTRYLRTDPARSMTRYSKRIVEQTMPKEVRDEIARQVEEIILSHNK